MGAAGDKTHFGFEEVALADKQARIDGVFRAVAHRYDLMNDLMTVGLHRAWKNVLVTSVDAPKTARPFALLDVAGGTGDIAMRVVQTAGGGTHAVVVDINPEMIAIGRARAGAEGIPVSFVEANAEALPFADASYDALTIAFGIRNVPRIETALDEARRVLRIGGHFLCLEFSKVDVPGLAALYDLYSFNALPALGRVVAGDGQAYRYLAESIRRFPAAQQFAQMLSNAGFGRVSYRQMSGGIVALHSGWRL